MVPIRGAVSRMGNRGLDIGVVCRKAARHHVVRVLQVKCNGK